MTGLHVKGSAFIPGFKFIIKHYEQKGMDKILAHMKQKYAEALRGKPLAGKWYPYKMFIDLLRASDDVLGKGDNTFIFAMASIGAKEGLSTFYKFVIKIGNPNHTISKTKKIWNAYFDFGKYEILKNEKGHAILRLTDWTDPRKELCVAISGWTQGALELAGATKVVIKETHCVCQLDEYCEWDVKWK